MQRDPGMILKRCDALYIDGISFEIEIKHFKSGETVSFWKFRRKLRNIFLEISPLAETTLQEGTRGTGLIWKMDRFWTEMFVIDDKTSTVPFSQLLVLPLGS